jgi:hypothetical protein
MIFNGKPLFLAIVSIFFISCYSLATLGHVNVIYNNFCSMVCFDVKCIFISVYVGFP